MEAFSDGVFAIAITLLVLDLEPPSTGDPWDRVADAWPYYVGYVVSFLTIGAAWLAHTAITDRLIKADLGLLRINLLLLLVVAVLPLTTRLVADSLHDIDGERVFVPMYGLVPVVPVVAVALCCAIAVALVVPIGEARRIVARRR